MSKIDATPEQIAKIKGIISQFFWYGFIIGTIAGFVVGKFI